MSSLKALARHLGLSITTVSRALDNYPDVAPATRERVHRAAREANYRPHSAARRLRKGTGETVAFVLPAQPGHFHEPVFAELLAAIGEHLATQHHDLILLAARPGLEEMATYRRLVESGRADAFILARTRRKDDRVAYLEAKGVPFICHGRTETKQPYAFVDGDGEAGFKALTSRLIGLGHRRIGYLSAPSYLTFATLRAAGWRQAMTEADLAETAQRLFAEDEPTEEGGHRLAAEMLAAEQPPTALVCATDRMALGAMQAVVEAGLVIGRDIAVTGHDNIPAASYARPGLTTMALPPAQVGTRLAEMVLARLGGADARDLTTIFDLRQIPRGSSAEA
ncbi:substrate-binding domain-containing protein [Bosea sp. NPDC055332]